ncbi:MAG: ribonuclease P protein component, partial [Polynucleobacter sp. 35-46-207]
MYWGLYLASPNAGAKPDLGIAVAKKLAKRAVDRNRLKRMIREVVRT